VHALEKGVQLDALSLRQLPLLPIVASCEQTYERLEVGGHAEQLVLGASIFPDVGLAQVGGPVGTSPGSARWSAFDLRSRSNVRFLPFAADGS
jgi:hypothetical protein